MNTIEEFAVLNSDERIRLICSFGESGNLNHFPFIKYAIESDDDKNVKFAAFKRIHLFKEHPETLQLLIDFKNTGKGRLYEPYYSMALSRLGNITIEEFENIIKGSK